MKKLFNLRTLFTLIIALTSTCVAQNEIKQNTSQTSLPSANDVFAKHTEAIGGRRAAERIKTRRIEGTAEIAAMNMKGTFEIVDKAPNKSLMTTNLTGYGEVINGFDGSEGGGKDPVQGRTSQA